jgi:hypothetical protein
LVGRSTTLPERGSAVERTIVLELGDPDCVEASWGKACGISAAAKAAFATSWINSAAAGGYLTTLGSPTVTPELKQTIVDGVLAKTDGRSADQLARERMRCCSG